MNPAPIVPVLPAHKRVSDGKREPRDVVVTLDRWVFVHRTSEGRAVFFRWRGVRWLPVVV